MNKTTLSMRAWRLAECQTFKPSVFLWEDKYIQLELRHGSKISNIKTRNLEL